MAGWYRLTITSRSSTTTHMPPKIYYMGWSFKSLARSVFVLFASLAALEAAPFQFTVVIQAGSAGGWQLGIGADAAHITSTDKISFPNGNQPEDFAISFNHLTNTATATYAYNSSTSMARVSLTAGGTFGGNVQWTLPAASFAVTAAAVPVDSELKADHLALNAGLNVVSPLSLTTLDAQRKAGDPAASDAETSAVVFSGNGGDWTLTGRLSWKGLWSQTSNGATGSGLGFTLTAVSNVTATPEPGSALLLLSAMPLLWLRARVSRVLRPGAAGR